MSRRAGPAKSESFDVMVESPRGATVKFKYDPAARVMTLSRPLPLGLVFPFDWGFVRATRAEDGDPLDAFILWDASCYPGIVIPCRAIGIVNLQQTSTKSGRRERNDRVAVVPVESPRHDALASALDLPLRVRREIEAFFLHSGVFEGKDAKVLSWEGPQAALRAVRQASRKARARRHARR
jgi:inorganic pyrophosphatase